MNHFLVSKLRKIERAYCTTLINPDTLSMDISEWNNHFVATIRPKDLYLVDYITGKTRSIKQQPVESLEMLRDICAVVEDNTCIYGPNYDMIYSLMSKWVDTILNTKAFVRIGTKQFFNEDHMKSVLLYSNQKPKGINTIVLEAYYNIEKHDKIEFSCEDIDARNFAIRFIDNSLK